MMKWYSAFVVVTAAAGAFCKSIRGSTWSSVFIVGAGGPGGFRLPWGKALSGSSKPATPAIPMHRRRRVFMILMGWFMVPFHHLQTGSGEDAARNRIFFAQRGFLARGC